MKPFLFFALVFLASLQHLHAKAYFQTEAELISQSAAIAILDIESPAPASVKGEHWTYREAAKAKVVQTIKGDLPAELTLHGHESFICAQCRLAPGRYLAFLQKDGSLWAGANWQFSLHPIREGLLMWYASSDDSRPDQKQSFEAVIKRIHHQLSTQAK